jgi:hypothetical protein
MAPGLHAAHVSHSLAQVSANRLLGDGLGLQSATAMTPSSIHVVGNFRPADAGPDGDYFDRACLAPHGIDGAIDADLRHAGPRSKYPPGTREREVGLRCRKRMLCFLRTLGQLLNRLAHLYSVRFSHAAILCGVA